MTRTGTGLAADGAQQGWMLAGLAAAALLVGGAGVLARRTRRDHQG